ncbi:MAG: TIM barrel protein [Armatimonadetes bacterium]|nr:TIM barrel protein [Armatimonadota bacterium]
MLWGYAGPWFGEFLQGDDSLMGRLKWLVANGLQAAHVGLNEIERLTDDERAALGEYLAEHDLHLVPGVHFDFLDADHDAIMRQTDAAIRAIGEYHELLRAPIVTTLVGKYHRFMREPSLQEQMDRLPSVIAPIAYACHEFGCPLGIENHGDYYATDLVELCRRTPFLGVFLDTGNTYLIGEQSLPAIRAAAPLTIGTHFKDHHVWPEKQTYPLRFEIGGAVLGEGDVGLREAYDILVENAPNPAALVMMIEMVPPRPMGPEECLAKTLAFVRSLPEVTP